MKRFLSLLILVLLAACGGGDEEDETASRQPVDCQARPEVCR